ncbi:reverse transcriptase [Trichuris suis]|nr:reverse transcriptase [Trichuris suis]
MEVDSGSACSLINERVFRQLNLTSARQTYPAKVLRTWSKEQLDVRSQVEVEVQYNGCKCRLPLVVVNGAGGSLLGRDWFEALDNLVNQGILKPVRHSKWATPIVPVLKRNGELRVCGDYRATVNASTKKDTYPLPTVTELMAALAGGVLFTKLDLTQAYQQLRVDDETAELLTLNTPKGLMEMTRLPFGVDVAPSIFQRFMDTCMAGLEGVKAYLDDVLITGRSEEEHWKRVEDVLARLSEVGVRLRRDKCIFGVKEVEYLGFRIDSQGVHPTAEKVEAIQKAPSPTNKTELQAFLGLLNFYSFFLPGKAEVMSPRMLRWSLMLAAYDYELRISPGVKVANADGLSRLPIPSPEMEIPPPGDIFLLETDVETPVDARTIEKLTRRDKTLSQVLHWALRGWPATKQADVFQSFIQQTSDKESPDRDKGEHDDTEQHSTETPECSRPPEPDISKDVREDRPQRRRTRPKYLDDYV